MTDQFICLSKNCEYDRIFNLHGFDYHDDHRYKRYIAYKKSTADFIANLINHENYIIKLSNDAIVKFQEKLKEL